MRILITGASGFVGANLAHWFVRRGHLVTGTYHRHKRLIGYVDMVPLDVTDEKACLRVLADVVPYAVLHVAGVKDVAWCEDHPDKALLVNAAGVGNVARAAAKVGAEFVYLSTDYVFGTNHDNADWRIDHDPRPETIYGKTKLMGEWIARRDHPDALIVRSGGLFGPGSPLLAWARQRLREGKPIEAFKDTENCPTYTSDLAESLEKTMQAEPGTFHLVGWPCQRAEFFRAFIQGCDLGGPEVVREIERPAECLIPRRLRLRSSVCLSPLEKGFRRLLVETGGVCA